MNYLLYGSNNVVSCVCVFCTGGVSWEGDTFRWDKCVYVSTNSIFLSLSICKGGKTVTEETSNEICFHNAESNNIGSCRK